MNKKTLVMSVLMIVMVGYNVVGSENMTNITINNTQNISNGSNISVVPGTITPNMTLNPTPNPTITPIPTASPTPIVDTTTTPQIPTVSPTPIVDIKTTSKIQNITTTPTINPVTTQGKTKSHKEKSIDTVTPTENPTEKETNISIQPVIILTSIPTTTPTSGSGLFGDFYDKIVLAVVVGFIGLSYEVVRINYDHKKRDELEKKKIKHYNEDLEASKKE